MNCPECGHTNPEELELCEKCGQPLVDDEGVTGIRPAPTPDDSEVTGLRPAPSPSDEEDDKTGVRPVPSANSSDGSDTESPTTYRSAARSSQGTPLPAPSAATGELPAYVSFGDRYEILELLGEGGMGRVYKAWDRELEKVIALKTIRGEMANKPELVKRFKQELLLARKITHKNVIRIHDLGEAEGVRFFTMEYIPGESLKRRVEKAGKIPSEEAVSLLTQMLGALEEAHRQGVIHRDLKPENIMIDPEGVLHIMDFGIARSAQDTGGMTAQGTMIGTPDYMSPEQVRGEKADAQSDLFAFGVILYEMLTGQLPFQGDTAASRVMMRLSRKPPSPREIEGQVPQHMESIVLKCLEIDRELRYKNAQEVLEDLTREQVDRSIALRIRRAAAKNKLGLAAVVAIGVAVGAAVHFANKVENPTLDVGGEVNATTIAILPFTNASRAEGLEWMRTGLSEMLVTDISQSRYLRPLPSGRVMKILDELGLSDQTRFDDASLKSISERAHVQSVLYGQFVESGGSLRLDLTLRQAGSGVPIPIKVEGDSSELFSLVDQITAQIKQQLDLTPEQLRADTDRPMAEVSTASLDALRAYQAGLAELQRGENQAAIPLLTEATERDTNFAMAHAKLADAYLKAGQYEDAEEAIDRAQALSETASLPLVERYQIHAIAAQAKNDYQTALESYSELAKLYPDDPDIQLSLGLVNESLGKFPEAGEAYARALELAPHYGEARFGLAYALLYSGKPDEGIQLLQDAIDSNEFSDDAEAMGMIHSILGFAYSETGGWDEAIEHFQSSLDYRTKAGNTTAQVVSMTNLAGVYLDKGEIETCLEQLGEALKMAREIGAQEDESIILTNTGIAHQLIGDLDKALSLYRESMQIEMERQDHVNQANRLDHIANVYRLQGQYDDALIYLEQAKTHAAQSGEKRSQALILIHSGLVRKAQGLYEQALEALLEALAITQEIGERERVAETQTELAWIYLDQGRFGDSYNALQQSLEIYVGFQSKYNIASVKTSLGRLFIDIGRLADAQKELAEAEQAAIDAKAQGLLPEILITRSALARLQGKLSEAAAASERAKAIADQIGLKEAAVASRIEIGRVHFAQGKLSEVEGVLKAAKQETGRGRLRPLEAKADVVLARLRLAQGDTEGARKAAREAISATEKFSGRPILVEAYSILGESLVDTDNAAAVEAYAQAASNLAWIQGSLLPEHVDSFMGREDIRAMAQRAVEVLEGAGRATEAAPLKKWTVPSVPAPDPS